MIPLLGALLALTLPNVPPHAVQPLLRQPALRGDRVAFVCEGDLWIGSLATGQATRLTSGEGNESQPILSPDGSQVAFLGSYDGPNEVYVVPTSGGAPRRLTWRANNPTPVDWSPDGARVLITAQALQGKTRVPYLVPAVGGSPEGLPLETVGGVGYAPDGDRVVFNRFPRAREAWFRYQGGTKNDIWVGSLKARTFRKVYTATYTCEYPTWAGDRVAFVTDDGGTFSVRTVRPDGSDPKRLAGPFPDELRDLRSDGVSVIYERNFGLEVCELSTGKTRPVRFTLLSDLRHTRPYTVSATEQIFSVSIGPTGARVLVETRGQIASIPVKPSDARVVLARPGVRFRAATLSPDAAKIAYLSDETGEQQLYVANADGAAPRALTRDAGRQLDTIVWSPDSQWIALTDSEKRLRLIAVATGAETIVATGTRHDNFWRGPEARFSPDSRWVTFSLGGDDANLSRVMVYEIATSKLTALSNGISNDFAPAFSSDGKWLALLSQRNLAAADDPILNQLDVQRPVVPLLIALRQDTLSPLLPVDEEERGVGVEAKKPEASANPPTTQIDFDGIAERFVELPVPPDNYGAIQVVGDRVLLAARPGVRFYDLKTRKSGVIAEGFESFQVSADGKKLLLDNGALSQVVDIGAQNVAATDGRLEFGNLQLSIDPVSEWKNEFWDAHRLIRDYFYVKNLHGADWKAVGEKYAALLPSVRSRGELTDLLRWMLAELSVSHAFVGGGRQKSVTVANPPPAFLGIDTAPDPSGFVRIDRVLRGDGFSSVERSPLAAPGLNVRDGDFLIAVDGVSTREAPDYQKALAGRAGQVVTVTVNDKPGAEGARTLRVRPVASEGRMRYVTWVAERREYVRKASNGRLGYVHLNNMSAADMSDFVRQYFPQRMREALVVDTRYNGGGYICMSILNILRSRPIAFFNQRNDPISWTRQWDYFAGPMACLINEGNASDGEEFPYYFKALGLGTVIGRRTWGGEVGSAPGWPLADGGTVSVPNYGAWAPGKGWIIEQVGVTPDIDVENDPTAFAQGKDPQLDRAIAHLLGQIGATPKPRPTQPPDPVRAAPLPR